MSIKPRWVSLIFDGLKTVELRKTRPKIDEPYKVYVYESQGLLEEPWMDEDGHMIWRGSGTVVGEFVCNKILRLDADSVGLVDYGTKEYVDMFPDTAYAPMDKTCLDKVDFMEYANGKQLYGWIIEEPKRYETVQCLTEYGLKRPPQSWCYVKGE